MSKVLSQPYFMALETIWQNLNTGKVLDFQNATFGEIAQCSKDNNQTLSQYRETLKTLKELETDLTKNETEWFVLAETNKQECFDILHEIVSLHECLQHVFDAVINFAPANEQAHHPKQHCSNLVMAGKIMSEEPEQVYEYI